MFREEFIDFISTSINFGNKTFANNAKSLIYGKDKKYLELLDFSNDEIFREPILLSHFSGDGKETTLDQLLFAHLKDVEIISAKSSEQGFIFLPNIGFLKTSEIKKGLKLIRKEDSISVVSSDNKTIPYKLFSNEKIKNTNIELPINSMPYLTRCFSDRDIDILNFEFSKITNFHRYNIEKSFLLIKKVFPILFDWINSCVRRIQVFENPKVWSFAEVTSYGISYLSANFEKSVVFFLEDVIHQSAHNIFYACTYFDQETLFEVSPTSKMSDITESEDHREIYGLFHGLFTQSCISVFFDKCIESQYFNELEDYEIKGRLTDNLTRWVKKLDFFRTNKVLTEIGLEYLSHFEEIYNTMVLKYDYLLTKYDVSNQPYIFDFNKFIQANGNKV